ncbi:hypothetical protein [Legionella sp. WA2022007384]
MSDGKNIFDFLRNTNGINQEIAIDFIAQIMYTELPEFAQQLISFLQDADEKAIMQLNILETVLRAFFSQLLHKFKVTDKCDLLRDLKNIGFNLIQKDLQDQQTSIEFRRRLEGILVYQTKKIEVEIQQVKKEFTQIEDEIKNIAPITYHVVFATPNKNEIYLQAFPSLAKAKDFIFKQQDMHNRSSTNYTAQKCDYFVVEIQAGEGSNEFNKAKKAITDLNTIPYSRNPRAPIWSNRNINSISWVAKRKEIKEPDGLIPSHGNHEIPAALRYPLEPVNKERLYNPNGTDSVARAIKQLDSMIERLQKTNWVWKIIDALVEAVTKRPSLTNKKIQALTIVRNDVLKQKNAIESEVISLREVLNKELEKKVNPTTTIKNILHAHRFWTTSENTNTDDAFDELLNATRPKPT